MRETKRNLLQELELLIIDEVSMLRADLLDTIDFVLRNIRRQTHKPFGGVQVLFIGDLMQLPPVVKEEEWQVLKQFYVSEKASMLNAMNHYVFKVFDDANKAEIKKQVEKVFDVKVKAVKISNMPKKRRDLGKHPGFKSGFKKATVVLKEGYSIEQAR